MLKVLDCCRKLKLNRNISICKILLDENKKPKRKVTETVVLVTLVDQNDKILGLKPKDESEKLAKRLNLILERVTDPKFGKSYPAYKMISPADLLKEEKKSTTAKTLKKLSLNSRISDHDLSVKLKTIKKWMEKNCEVHITILGKNEPQSVMKTVYSKIEAQLKGEFRILDVRIKGDSIKFIIIPPKTAIPEQDQQKKKPVEGG